MLRPALTHPKEEHAEVGLPQFGGEPGHSGRLSIARDNAAPLYDVMRTNAQEQHLKVVVLPCGLTPIAAWGRGSLERRRSMRVLLIDNHDSFSYNLAHDIAIVTGKHPDVVLNDDPPVHWSALSEWLSGYDAIVVSPGPGTPERFSDLMISHWAIAQHDVPVLGICLGMQAIAHDAGVPIIRAPRPVHGEVADIQHHGAGLFTGLPSPLGMVRYHSLVVDPQACESCDDIVVDARDGDIVMALHRRSRPQWGLQAHPESVCSENGQALLTRFFELARDWNQQHGRSEVSRPEYPDALPPASQDNPNLTWQVLLRRVRTAASSETIFDTLFRHDDHPWWLDSATGDGVSMCGSAAGPLARVAVAEPGGVRVRDANGNYEIAQDLLNLVERTFGAVRVVDLGGEGLTAADLPFTPGWVGYLGYEYTCRWLPPYSDGSSQAAATQSGNGDVTSPATLVFGDRAVAIEGSTAWVMALTQDRVEALQHEWVTRTAEQLRTLTTPPTSLPNPPVCDEVTVRHDRAEYIRLIERCKEKIRAGESYELCLTNRIRVAAHSDPWAVYRRLRTLSPRPFAAYLAFEDHHVLSASPERFLKVQTDRQIEAKPIKGTRARSEDQLEDARLAEELVQSVKERAENLMIVDLLRHDLSRVCSPGTVHVPLLFDVESHAGAHQLVSTVRGTLIPSCSPLDAVRSALPGGSMTGAPKERSVSILRELEDGPRGIYSGVLGYFSVNGTVDLSIIIRTIVHQAEYLDFGMGGAITTRSDALEEWEETLVKARTFGVALGLDLDTHMNVADVHEQLPNGGS